MGSLNTLDFIVITLYFLLVFGIAWYVTTKEKSGANSSN